MLHSFCRSILTSIVVGVTSPFGSHSCARYARQFLVVIGLSLSIFFFLKENVSKGLCSTCDQENPQQFDLTDNNNIITIINFIYRG